MKIFGHPMSTCTRKVLMTLAETNTPYELEVVEFATGEHKKPPHLARQPFGQVPALKDGDFEMFESRAMCRYINDKAKAALVPSDLRDRAKVEQWISIETSDFNGAAMKFVFNDIFKFPQAPEVLATAAAQLNQALGVMEKELGAHEYMATGAFSLADICFMPYVDYAMMTPAQDIIAKYPKVTAWWSKVGARPTWSKAVGRA